MEIVRRGYEAFNRGDFEGWLAGIDPDVELDERYIYIAALSEVFEWVRTEPLEVIDGGDRAVVCNRFQARGRLSEVEVEDHFFHAMRLRNGKALWWDFYPSKAEALEAVGLRE